jgi:hypothetical protein
VAGALLSASAGWAETDVGTGVVAAAGRAGLTTGWAELASPAEVEPESCEVVVGFTPEEAPEEASSAAGVCGVGMLCETAEGFESEPAACEDAGSPGCWTAVEASRAPRLPIE